MTNTETTSGTSQANVATCTWDNSTFRGKDSAIECQLVSHYLPKGSRDDWVVKGKHRLQDDMVFYTTKKKGAPEITHRASLRCLTSNQEEYMDFLTEDQVASLSQKWRKHYDEWQNMTFEAKKASIKQRQPEVIEILRSRGYKVVEDASAIDPPDAACSNCHGTEVSKEFEEDLSDQQSNCSDCSDETIRPPSEPQAEGERPPSRVSSPRTTEAELEL